MQKKLEKAGRLLDKSGDLNDYGWSERPVLQYDRSWVRAHGYRIKEWDYYMVLGPQYGLAFTIASLGYMNQLSLSAVDLRNKRAATKTPMEWLPRIKAVMPADTGDSVAEYAYGGLSLRFQRSGEKRILTVDCPGFDGGAGLSGSVELTQGEGDESMVHVSPFSKRRRFYLNEKIVAMPAQGSFKYGDETWTFSSDSAFGTLDWGRGVWTYQNTWYWGGGAGYVGGKRFGFNIGYGFGANDRATENAFFLDGKIHKLDQVTFNMNRNDYLAPSKFTSNDGRFEMDFVPILDRAAKGSIIAIKTDQHQVFGRFTGTVGLDDGTKLEVKDILGFAEDVFMRY
jgi:hypothetical protein